MKQRYLMLLFLGALLIAACDDLTDDQTPTAPTPTVASTATITLTPSASPSALPSPSAFPLVSETVQLTPPTATFPPTLTPTASGTPEPPTLTPSATFTPGPYEHTVRAGDDCIAIVYQYGHVDLDVLQEFYQLNNMGNNCLLPGPGAVVRVPRPTPKPGEEGVVQVGEVPEGPIFPPNAQPIFAQATYCVVQDDTLTSIALKNDTSLRKVCELNPLPNGLDCRGCDFSQSDVGYCPNPPLLSVGQCFIVPGPTPTASGTPLPTGNETATPTPTHRAPDVVYPQNGLTVSGVVRLQWVSVGRLQPGEFYVVNLTDETAGVLFIDATRDTYIEIPQDYIPRDGQPHQITWWVSVQIQGQDGLFVPSGGRTPDYRFVWESA
jgi:hypothetical protein